MTLPATTDLYAVVGNPVEHSRSPAIHSLFARQTGQTMDYTRLLAPLDGFAQTVRQWATEHPARGCNVTVPFKFEAFQMAGCHTERAVLAQAANTLVFHSPDPATWLADNTDGAGLMRDITVNADTRIQGMQVLLVGAGGASAGVLGPLIAQGPERICVANRTVSKAQDLVDTHRGWASQHGVVLQACSLDALSGPFDIVINGTAASLQGGAIPIPAGCIRGMGPQTLVVDMMYGPAAEPFLAWAREHGARTRDGLGMLVEQAAEAFHVWRGVRPDTAPVLEQLRNTV